MWHGIGEACRAVDAAPDVRVAVLMGAGGCFCAGLDVKAGSTLSTTLETMSPGQAIARIRQHLEGHQASFSAVESLRVPVIAAVRRACMGAGLELALCCDVRLAADGTLFSIPEVQLGLVPDMGGTQRLPRTVGIGKAKELIYSARRFDAAEALRIGLVQAVYPAGELQAAGGQARHQRHLLRRDALLARLGDGAGLGPAPLRGPQGRPEGRGRAQARRLQGQVRHPEDVMADLYDLGDRPPLGLVPKGMHAFAVRQSRFGPPRDAWKREVLPTPTIGPDEVLIYVMASGINYNNVWAALGQPLDVIAERLKMGEPEDFHAGGSDCSGIVWATGKDVRNVKVGDEVTGATRPTTAATASSRGPRGTSASPSRNASPGRRPAASSSARPPRTAC